MAAKCSRSCAIINNGPCYAMKVTHTFAGSVNYCSCDFSYGCSSRQTTCVLNLTNYCFMLYLQHLLATTRINKLLQTCRKINISNRIVANLWWAYKQFEGGLWQAHGFFGAIKCQNSGTVQEHFKN